MLNCQILRMCIYSSWVNAFLIQASSGLMKKVVVIPPRLCNADTTNSSLTRHWGNKRDRSYTATQDTSHGYCKMTGSKHNTTLRMSSKMRHFLIPHVIKKQLGKNKRINPWVCVVWPASYLY